VARVHIGDEVREDRAADLPGGDVSWDNLSTQELEQQANEMIAGLRAGVQPHLFVISGPSGVGKDSVIDELRQRLPDFYFAVTATTRPRRPGEIHGIHYFFLSEQEFLDDRDRGEFMEYAEVYGNWYGVPKARVRAALLSGRNAIVKVDVQGAATIRTLVPSAISIFLIPTSMDDLLRRLYNRKTDGPEVLLRRLRTVSTELMLARDFDYVVVNEDGLLDRATQDILSIISAEQLKINQHVTEL
jgi:guanylate kinase